MKQIIFYLDESGNSTSDFFSIGGFWSIIEIEPSKLSQTQKKILKIQSDIKRIEKTIKQNKAGFSKKDELKWVHLTNQEKEYLFTNLPNYGQNHISMTVDMKKWKEHNGSTDTTYIYNFLVYIMLEKLFELTNHFADIYENKPIKIILTCDERPTSPDSKHSLKDYLQWKFNEFYQNKQMKNPFLFSTSYEQSKHKPLIRYADYYVGLIQSVHKLKSGKYQEWDIKSANYYGITHQNINCCKCFMYPNWTISSSPLQLIHQNEKFFFI